MPDKIETNNALKNHLLAALPADEFRRVEAVLVPHKFKLGDVLYGAGDKMDCCFFPTTAIVSMLHSTTSGSTAEIGVIGNDGISGHALFLGGGRTTNRAVIQSAGFGYCMKAKDLKAEFARGGVFQKTLLRYTQGLMMQIAQIAVCNRLHRIDQQLCRWILLSHDRSETNRLLMTHDSISNMLGVRREGVTLAAKKLARRNLIKNSRGAIFITDRRGLEAAACECYGVVHAEYNRFQGAGVSRAVFH